MAKSLLIPPSSGSSVRRAVHSVFIFRTAEAWNGGKASAAAGGQRLSCASCAFPQFLPQPMKGVHADPRSPGSLVHAAAVQDSLTCCRKVAPLSQRTPDALYLLTHIVPSLHRRLTPTLLTLSKLAVHLQPEFV